MEFETIKNATSDKRMLAAEQLKKSRDNIRTLWEQRVHKEIVHPKLDKFPLINENLGIFLDELSLMLMQATPHPEVLYKKSVAPVYEEDPNLIEEYTLSNLLREFSILRETITYELEKKQLLTFEVRSIIDSAIDPAMALAANDFEKSQLAKLHAALSKAELSNRDLEQFAMIAAHDLNSPLATVTSLLALLKDSIKLNTSPETLEYIQFMEETLLRMRSLITSVLEYARLAQAEAQFKKIKLQEVFDASLQNLNNLITKEGARIQSDPLPEIYGDFNLLTQVFQNLLANSIKYRSDNAPDVQISVREQDPITWLFSVKDNGIGFEIKNNEEIFSLYKRLEDKVGTPGSGIGLATCRRVIELHGGKIWAESHPGVGSIFYFTLPKLHRR